MLQETSIIFNGKSTTIRFNNVEVYNYFKDNAFKTFREVLILSTGPVVINEVGLEECILLTVHSDFNASAMCSIVETQLTRMYNACCHECSVDSYVGTWREIGK